MLITKEELIDAYPSPELNRKIWPTRETLNGLTLEQLKDFHVDKLQFWDYNKSQNDSCKTIALRLVTKDGIKSPSLSYQNGNGQNLDQYAHHTVTINLKEVTAIEVYEGTQQKDKGTYVACIVFYKGNTIVGVPFAGELIGKQTDLTIKHSFIDKCPGNGFALQARYERP